MATTFQDYVFFQTTEMTSLQSYLQTRHQLTDGSNKSSFPRGINGVLDLLIIGAAMVAFSSIVVLLFLVYRYQRNKRKPSSNVEIIRFHYKGNNEIETTEQQHNTNKDHEGTRQQQSSGKESPQQKHSINEGGEQIPQQYATNGDRQESYIELEDPQASYLQLEDPQESYLELDEPQKFYLELEGDDKVADNDNVYENKEQPLYGNEFGEVSKEQDDVVLYENARSWESRSRPPEGGSFQKSNHDLTFEDEVTYQNISRVP